MNLPLTIPQALFAAAISGLVILGTRVLPFALFSRREVPSIIRFIEKYSPALIMAVLFVYCFKDVGFTVMPYGLPELISVALVVVLHLCFKNSMVSIFGGTILFLVLSRIM